ncbi:toll/interleukin-1 receptor domain-containing protein [Aeromonas salmonicida]|uniref:toll/interleukin-1 receptor domain-containing protein n=1 Tax=Aeromonas salmonicida TaxID=645 RepID=UPI0012D88DF9|nr:toll/interleukin-1 receptor domain-containing protein [Aeromonas salmonicida]MUG31053.1 toll/interleukin-1 receptor domain-containing protein [Aeromonas salmonicida]
MPVFISYSHSDKKKVDEIAAHLVKNRANVWVDTWELNVGDSILNRVQEAVESSGALLIMLSKASVKSEWCKKELTAGLMRELSEKRVVVLPVLIEDCEIPLFLRDKMYADFRTDFNFGLQAVLDGIAKVINSDQGRILDEDGYSDWAVDWGYHNDLFHMRFTIVHCAKSAPLTFITEVRVLCNEVGTRRYKEYESAGLDWIGRNVFAEMLFDIGEKEDIRLILNSQLPQEQKITSIDKKTDMVFEIHISSRKMGDDNGKDQLIDISEYLKGIRHYIRSVSRQPTSVESQKMIQIMSKPINA